jgi:hypothetical protein
MDTPFTNGYKYYCPVLLEFVDDCSSCWCPPDDKPLVETQEALIGHLLARGRDPALAWFALSGKDPLPGSDCAASPDQIKSVMAYTQAGNQPEPEYVAGKTDLPLSLVLNVFRFFGIPHKSPKKKGMVTERCNWPTTRREG